jgi:hypothetical protein
MSILGSGRRARPAEQISVTEKVIGAVILLFLAGLGGAVVFALTFHGEAERTPAATTEGAAKPVRPAGERVAAGHKPFDLPKLYKAGWTGPDQVQTFSPETVHQKIDGRDGLYLAYGIVGMTFGTYKYAGNQERYVDVYVYDMGRPFNAFGSYKAEFAEGMPPTKIGRGGYQAERSLFYWKGADYVQLVAGDGVTKEDDPVLRGLAEQIAAAITDDGTPLWGDDVLPKAGRKPNGLGYERINAFSLDFLRDVFRADYTDGSSQYAMFIHRSAGPAAARKVLDEYAAYLGKHGKVLSRQETQGGQTLVGEATGMFDVVFCKGPYVGGVNGAEKRDLAERQAAAFREGLK